MQMGRREWGDGEKRNPTQIARCEGDKWIGWHPKQGTGNGFHIYTWTHTRSHTHTYKYVHTHTQRNTHTQTHTHTHTQIFSSDSSKLRLCVSLFNTILLCSWQPLHATQKQSQSSPRMHMDTHARAHTWVYVCSARIFMSFIFHTVGSHPSKKLLQFDGHFQTT